MKLDILTKAASEARGLAIDGVHACSSGHLGLPLGCAEIGAVLFGETLAYNPNDTKWLNRDRFILSAGHGSMFIYSWLHLAGYDLSIDEIRNFRKLHSITPGHPEYRETPGVEATTGPLGQGVANLVGYAISGKMSAAKYNTDVHTIFDHHVVALAGDGCLQEGVAREAIEFAGHNELDNLILIYDSNDVTLDEMADKTQSTDVEAYFKSMNWDAVTIDGHDLNAIEKALKSAKDNNNGQPKIIIARTEIGRGIPEVAGSQKAHGEGGAKFSEEARAGLGLPEELFYVSPEVKSYFASRSKEGAEKQQAWNETYAAWQSANPELAQELTSALAGEVPTDLLDRIPEISSDAATRGHGGAVINEIAKHVPNLITGSADLFGSNKNYIKGGDDFGKANRAGRNIWYGIREHAMGAILNGIAYDGIFKASGATFCVFADYLRPSIRLAALAELPVSYVFTHDSVGVGEDGPTHQPVETISGLRVIPNLNVFRPCDGEETAAAWVSAVSNNEGPTALILSRQGLPNQGILSGKERREGTLKGAYVLKKETGELKAIVIATGTEVQHAVEAANELGEGVRVVSAPCLELFDKQSAEYRESVLPATCTKRVAIEAGVSGLWWKYVGTEGKVLGIDRFGISAPGDIVMKELGMTKEHVVKALS